MADEGPTTAGSIIGKLSIDRTEWLRDSAATKADAKELGDLDPTIHVKANVGDALAEFESLKAAQAAIGGNVAGPTVGGSGSADAVTAAQKRMASAMAAAKIAAQAEELAAQRLDAAQTARGRTDISVAAAELALARATNTAAAAQAKSLAAGQALEEEQRKAAAAALENAAAQDTQAKATDNTGHSMSRLQAIFTAVVALGPGLIPIAGWAVGAGGALTAMLGAGVLAILGIRNELKNGGADANAFAAGLASLKGDLGTLETTAAHGVLNGFQSVVGQLNDELPMLNQETEMYSRLLGSIASTSTEGLLGGWKQLSPLVADVASYLVAVDQRLASFAMSPQFASFVSYAEQNLPRVENLLDSLVATAFHVLAAFAPWGGLVVDVLTDVSNVIDAIPTPILATLIELALGGALAFKAWTSIPVMLASVATAIGAVTVAEDGATVATGALGAAIDFMEGPIGWVIAGLGALVAVLAATSSAQETATTSASDYASAVALDNGVIGENVRLQAAKNLQDSGAIANLKELGVSTDKAVQAALGNSKAQKEVNAQIDAGAKAIKAHEDAQEDATGTDILGIKAKLDSSAASDNAKKAIIDENAAVKSAIGAYNDLQASIGGTTISTKEQLQAQQDLAGQYGVSLSAYESAIAGQKKTADQAKATTLQLQLENDAAGLLQGALDKLNGKALSAADAQNSFDSSLANMGTHVTDAGKQITFTTANIHNMSAASVSLRGQLNGQISALEQVVEANGGLSGSTTKARAEMMAMRKQIIDNAVAHGVNRNAVTQYIDSILKIPKSIPPTKLDIDTAAAEKKLAKLKADIDAILHSGVLTPGAAKQAAKNAKTLSLLATPSAAGSTVTGVGTSTSDSNLYALSVGEEVTQASRASAYRPMLKAINNGSREDIAKQAAALAPAASSQTVDHRSFVLNQYYPVHTDPVQSARRRFQQMADSMQAGGL